MILCAQHSCSRVSRVDTLTSAQALVCIKQLMDKRFPAASPDAKCRITTLARTKARENMGVSAALLALTRPDTSGGMAGVTLPPEKRWNCGSHVDGVIAARVAAELKPHASQPSVKHAISAWSNSDHCVTGERYSLVQLLELVGEVHTLAQPFDCRHDDGVGEARRITCSLSPMRATCFSDALGPRRCGGHRAPVCPLRAGLRGEDPNRGS